MFPRNLCSYTRAQPGRIAILIDIAEQACTFSERVPESAVELTDELGLEVIATLRVIVKIVNLAHHYSLADPASPKSGRQGGGTS